MLNRFSQGMLLIALGTIVGFYAHHLKRGPMETYFSTSEALDDFTIEDAISSGGSNVIQNFDKLCNCKNSFEIHVAATPNLEELQKEQMLENKILVDNLQAKLKRCELTERIYENNEDNSNLRRQLVEELIEVTDLRTVLDFQFELFSNDFLKNYKDKESALDVMKNHFGAHNRMDDLVEIYTSTYTAQQLADLISYYDNKGGVSLAMKEQQLAYKIKNLIDKLVKANSASFFEEIQAKGIK